MTRRPLTPRQRECLSLIVGHIIMHGYPPTVRELSAQLRVASDQAARDHITALLRKGWITRDGGAKSRAIRILHLPEVA
jgi:repressor LexA